MVVGSEFGVHSDYQGISEAILICNPLTPEKSIIPMKRPNEFSARLEFGQSVAEEVEVLPGLSQHSG